MTFSAQPAIPFKPRAIPTLYRGVSMRSRFEADAAMWMDSHRIGWSYEPQSYLLGQAGHYLPDFRLPALSSWFECRGYAGRDEQLAAFGDRCAARGERFVVLRWDRPAEIVGPWGSVGPATVRVCPACRALYFDGMKDHGCVGCGCIGEQSAQAFGAASGRLYPELSDDLRAAISATSHLEPAWDVLNTAPVFDLDRFWELKDEADAVRETLADSTPEPLIGGLR